MTTTSYSPHREGSGLMQMHSPKHSNRHFDPHCAISEIRRNLSRSPSKSFYLKTTALSGSQPYIASPLSPSRRSTSDNFLQLNACTSPLGIRTTQSGRITRPNLRRTAQTCGVLKTRTSPRSPTKMVLLDSSESQANTPTLRKRRSAEIDNDEDFLMSDKENMPAINQEQSTMWKIPHVRHEKRKSGGIHEDLMPLSPLKRTDTVMNLDSNDCGSPSAKRRSIHVPGALDFSIFDSDSHGQEKRSQDDHDWFKIPSSPSSRFSTIPKRSSSLRKSTLQQRGERGSPFRLSQFAQMQQNWSENSPFTKPPRMSLDNHLSLPPHESPFSQQDHLLNASIHPIAVTQQTDGHQTVFKHPLSRTITQSTSSTPDLQDDSPTHEPFRRLDRAKPHDFSKSLPLGALRPHLEDEDGHGQPSSQLSVATPSAYKAAKPLPAAFMSTGLISKKNRNVNEVNGGLPKAHMPDTPCKKQSTMFAPPQGFRVSRNQVDALRHSSFEAPQSPSELPFNVARQSRFPWNRTSIGLPPRARQGLARKASFANFLSIEAEKQASSKTPSAQHENQPSVQGLSPTPTKTAQLCEIRASSVSPSPQHVAPASVLLQSTQPSRFAHFTSSFQGFDTSPHTPLESVFPPDPSSLSISGKFDRPVTRNGGETPFFPATPTGPKEYFDNFSNRPSLNLNAPEISDVDACLSARFEKVDLVGTGEFSQVYRVTSAVETSPYNKSFSTSRPCSARSEQGKVFAVKKSRHQYAGIKDRSKKLQEVEVLKRLANNDHVLSFVDSWEDNNYLYIQTEFCEEGTLDAFLIKAGNAGRLDDFRIWKILLELSLGLKSIHDTGYIHLDLKPANVLVNFEGVLKIADFGMATRWPAQAGIEGEGDRNYISPEVMKGQYDKPSDIFALGLCMLEIAANVELPPNGNPWQKLRNGDLSDVPSLSWSSDHESTLERDAMGTIITEQDDNGTIEVAESAGNMITESAATKVAHILRRGELVRPPPFMVNALDAQSLDQLVKWMISPEPLARPVIDQILEAAGVQWVANRRRAGATIFEGNWGPADEVLAEDSEMMDV